MLLDATVLAGENLIPPLCGRIDNLLRHLVQKCSHFSDSRKREEAEKELKKRNERRRLQYYGTCNPAFRPTPDSKHHLSSKCSFTDGIKWHPHTIACPPKPRPAHSYANSLLTFETPAPALEPSIPPTLPLVRVDDCDPEPQNRDKRPRLTLDTTPQSGNNLEIGRAHV